jgi:hypothetical protein
MAAVPGGTTLLVTNYLAEQIQTLDTASLP